MEPEEELSTMWNSEENNSFENTAVKIENFDDDFSPDTNENCSSEYHIEYLHDSVGI